MVGLPCLPLVNIQPPFVPGIEALTRNREGHREIAYTPYMRELLRGVVGSVYLLVVSGKVMKRIARSRAGDHTSLALAKTV